MGKGRLTDLTAAYPQLAPDRDYPPLRFESLKGKVSPAVGFLLNPMGRCKSPSASTGMRPSIPARTADTKLRIAPLLLGGDIGPVPTFAVDDGGGLR